MVLQHDDRAHDAETEVESVQLSLSELQKLNCFLYKELTVFGISPAQVTNYLLDRCVLGLAALVRIGEDFLREAVSGNEGHELVFRQLNLLVVFLEHREWGVVLDLRDSSSQTAFDQVSQ